MAVEIRKEKIWKIFQSASISISPAPPILNAHIIMYPRYWYFSSSSERANECQDPSLYFERQYYGTLRYGTVPVQKASSSKSDEQLHVDRTHPSLHQQSEQHIQARVPVPYWYQPGTL